jgi:long-chain acyl-CoA synthetase
MGNFATVIDPHPDDAVALVAGNHTTTYGELRTEVGRLRGGLARLGVGAGDRVALVLPNGPTFVTTYLAVLGMGAVAVPLNPASPTPELQRELTMVRPKLLVCDPTAAAAVAELDRTAAGVELVVDAHGASGPLPDAVPLVELTDPSLGAPDPVPAVDRGSDDLAALVFTSGTAGAPRAAMLTHGNLRTNVDQLIAADGDLGPQDVSLGAVPMFHIYGLNVVLGVTLATGGSVVLLDRFDAAEALAAIRDRRATVVVGVPTMWSALAAVPDASPEAVATVRLAATGAAPLLPEVGHAVLDRLGLELTQGYGLTEAAPAVTSCLGVDAPPGSIGRPLPGVSLRLVDPDTRDDVLVDDPGEVWVQGPNVFAGYWDDPEATATALTPDGWLRTGDVAVVDDEGFLHLVDRAKDLIIVSGFNVFPAEVEEVLVAHPDVAEAAVTARPDPHTGEAVTAHVVPVGPGGTVDPESLATHARAHLARYKCPTQWHVVTELPHNITGKVVRRQLG